MIDPQKLEKIQNILKNSDRGRSITELVRDTGFSKTTIKTYVAYLFGQKSITFDICGNNKLVCLNKSPVETKGRVD